MRTGLVAKKIGMTSIFDDAGNNLPVTVLHVPSSHVICHKTVDKNGYNALVIGYIDISIDKLPKPTRTLFIKNKLAGKKKMIEFRVSTDCFLDLGNELTVNHFQIGQFLDVAATSIGKGFAGSMKRHNFSGLGASHGVSVSHRSHGSTGGNQDPGKVWKGKKMAGHMGNKRVSIQNLSLVNIDSDKSLLFVLGNVPGASGGYVEVKDSVKKYHTNVVNG
ncbi:MAG: 50S ribosomal protein L3 [Rickettsiaceae bacterium]